MRILSMAALLALVTACSASSTSGVVAGDSTPSPSAPASATAPTTSGDVKAPAAVKLTRTDEFGLVTAVRREAGKVEVDVDRVDMLSGAEGEAAAKAAGADYSNDYFLRNERPRLRTYTVRPDAQVWGSIAMLPHDEPWPKAATVGVWTAFLASPAGRTTLFHFEVEGGTVTGVEEQYRP